MMTVQPNKSPEPTVVGGFSSFAGVVGCFIDSVPRWLSFFS
jgi:hypothetical protein